MNYPQQIFQCYASYPMERHFAINLRKKWGLSEYKDPNAPTVIFGWYNDSEDFPIINNHKGPLVMLWGGADMDLRRIEFIKNKQNAYQIGYGWQENLFKQVNAPYKRLNIPYTSYDDFKPTPLGDKIYVYRGWKVPRNQHFYWDSLIEPLMGVFGPESFIHGMGHDLKYVHEHFYKQSFVYLKPNERGGSTSMWQLGHMGRKTIAQNQGGAPNVLEYKDIHHIIELIQQEAEKIGTIQEQVAIDTINYFDDDFRWLNIDYYGS